MNIFKPLLLQQRTIKFSHSSCTIYKVFNFSSYFLIYLRLLYVHTENAENDFWKEFESSDESEEEQGEERGKKIRWLHKKNMQILLLYFHNLDNENGDESVGDDEEEFEDEEDEEMTVMKEVVMNFSDIEKR